ncbi:MAG: DUF1761 domain-containing protein [Actinobacteria bacterium]|nr:DUF1761 domain-containing protein [Actinomycetota bacterium]
MTINNIHWTAVLVSALVSIASGAIWFGPRTFYPSWAKAMGKTDGEVPGAGMNMAVVFGSTFISQFVQATAMAILLTSMDGLNAAKGLLAGLVIGIGIAAASSLGHRLFSGHGFKVWAIEVSNDVLNLALMGLIIGAWG